MNALQEYIEQQKAFFSKKIAEDTSKRLPEIFAMIRENKPGVRFSILEYCDHLTDVYRLLLLADIEGEILSIIKRGEKRYEKYSSAGLLNDWQFPDHSIAERAARAAAAIKDRQAQQHQAEADAADCGVTD
jgi:hypothetical protein